MGPFVRTANKLKKMWLRFALHDIRYSNNYNKLDRIYMVSDPWNMASPAQQYRFAETNRIIIERFGRVGSLLEIGCGEGHQSLQLQQICDHLIGLDVSNKAVARARRRCPESEFLVGDVFSKEVRTRAPFDLVVACEVLYYMSDVPAALRLIRELGRNCLVTYFAGEIDNMDLQVSSFPGAVSEMLEFEQARRWRAVWWRGERV